MARSLGELAAQFGCELIGDPAVAISGVATLRNATTGQLSFFASKAYREQLKSTQASVVLLQKAHVSDCPVAALVSDDPYLTYAHIAGELHPEPALVAGIHAAAVVEPGASVADTAKVCAHATVFAGASVGDGAFVGPGAVVGPGCCIGPHTKVLANVTLVQNVVIGARCIINPGAVLGSDGFGNAKSSAGWVKIPQVGGVVIGDDVEIGANTTVDRGAIDDTVIGNGARLDNLIQIGHNVQIGAHTALAALTGVSGSTVIGERCMFGGQAGIVGHLRICDDVIIGGATMISKDINEPGFYTGSFPGENDRDWKRKVARFRRMDELVNRVVALEKTLQKGNLGNDGE